MPKSLSKPLSKGDTQLDKLVKTIELFEYKSFNQLSVSIHSLRAILNFDNISGRLCGYCASEIFANTLDAAEILLEQEMLPPTLKSPVTDRLPIESEPPTVRFPPTFRLFLKYAPSEIVEFGVNSIATFAFDPPE